MTDPAGLADQLRQSRSADAKRKAPKRAAAAAPTRAPLVKGTVVAPVTTWAGAQAAAARLTMLAGVKITRGDLLNALMVLVVEDSSLDERLTEIVGRLQSSSS